MIEKILAQAAGKKTTTGNRQLPGGSPASAASVCRPSALSEMGSGFMIQGK
jgi:hypothetical protein